MVLRRSSFRGGSYAAAPGDQDQEDPDQGIQAAPPEVAVACRRSTQVWTACGNGN